MIHLPPETGIRAYPSSFSNPPTLPEIEAAADLNQIMAYIRKYVSATNYGYATPQGRIAYTLYYNARYAINAARGADAYVWTDPMSNGLANRENVVYELRKAISEPAVISITPTTFSVSEGGTLTMTAAAATGFSTLYQWYCNGSAIDGATSNQYTTPVQYMANNGDQYYCLLYNSYGSKVTATKTLTVLSIYPKSLLWYVSGDTPANGSYQRTYNYSGGVWDYNPVFDNIGRHESPFEVTQIEGENHVMVRRGFYKLTIPTGVFNGSILRIRMRQEPAGPGRSLQHELRYYSGLHNTDWSLGTLLGTSDPGDDNIFTYGAVNPGDTVTFQRVIKDDVASLTNAYWMNEYGPNNNILFYLDRP
jgi:hypothetical protein